MNRANFGNITTNGMQILSVGATTASHFAKEHRLAQLHETLNNQPNAQESPLQQKISKDVLDNRNRINKVIEQMNPNQLSNFAKITEGIDLGNKKEEK